jgi:signal transduction histidine kinase
VVILLAYTAGAHLQARRAIATLALLIATVVVATLVDDYNEAASDVAFIGIVILAGPALLGWLIGSHTRLSDELRRRNEQLEREREARAQRAVADERARIARELHDVMAHSVSVMVIQAGGARRVLDRQPDRAEAAFGAIETTGRDALHEMRQLLGLLRPAGEAPSLTPPPGLDRLPELIQRAREAGLTASLAVTGDAAPLAPGADVAAYRVAQEAITNALKHAAGSRVRVELRYGTDGVELQIADDGSGTATAPVAVASGHGLVGMRERVALQGGAFAAGPDPDGRGFLVRARFPRAEVPA